MGLIGAGGLRNAYHHSYVRDALRSITAPSGPGRVARRFLPRCVDGDGRQR